MPLGLSGEFMTGRLSSTTQLVLFRRTLAPPRLEQGGSPLEIVGGVIIGLLILYAAMRTALDSSTRSCPSCGERVKSSVKVCRFCGAQVAGIKSR